MTLTRIITRLTLAAALIASLGACTVVPAYPAGYRASPAYVESYPVYRTAPPTVYYGYDQGYRGHENYRDNYRYEDRRSYNTPFDDAARVHRDIRRSLGLPRLPGMP